jgi:flagellin-like hook-associated protein FlgL
MSHKFISSLACNAEDISITKKFSHQGTDLKNLDQALNNVLLGREILTLVENAFSEIEAILSQVKHWLSSSSVSSLEKSQKTMLELKIYMRLRELDQLAESLMHRGQKLLNGTLSASVKSNLHLFLLVGTISSPENRINLNTRLNIPPISSKNLGLGELSIISEQTKLKGLVMLENALAIIIRLKQRSTALETHLQKINQHLSTAIENHHAANTAPDSFEETGEFIKVVTGYIKNNKSVF